MSNKLLYSLALVLTCVFMLPVTAQADEASAVWSGGVSEPTKITVIDKINYYEISTAEELAYIAKTGGDWLTYNYVLTQDIVLNDTELTVDANGKLTADRGALKKWSPIHEFSGVFDGNNHKITGLYVDTNDRAGFFTKCNGDVRNVTFQNAYVKGDTYVGGICSNMNGRDMENCFFDGAVVGKSKVGGLIGNQIYVDMKNCGNYADVWATGDYAGGIAGDYTGYSINNTFNEGTIYSTGNYVGGIIGNTGLYGLGDCVNRGNVIGKEYVGGIVGKSIQAYIARCGNTGTIQGEKYVGGICGEGRCSEQTEAHTAQFVDVFNTGAVRGKSNVGGIVGYTYYGDLTRAYHVGTVTGEDAVGNIIGHTESVWGKGTVTECYYLEGSSLKGFGNGDDMEAVVGAQPEAFFCRKSDGTLNFGGHAYDENNACDTDCQHCGYLRTVEHRFETLAYDEASHWYECQCGAKDTAGQAAHFGGSASCAAKAKCEVCRAEYGDYAEHGYYDRWNYDSQSHWRTCSCGETTEKVSHTFDIDGVCPECQYYDPGQIRESQEESKPASGSNVSSENDNSGKDNSGKEDSASEETSEKGSYTLKDMVITFLEGMGAGAVLVVGIMIYVKIRKKINLKKEKQQTKDTTKQ